MGAKVALEWETKLSSKPSLVEGSGEPWYLVIFSERASRVVPLPAAGRLCIGRHGNAEIVLDSLSVSRRHALLEIEGEEVWLRDLGSRNGTYVNGERLSQPRVLLPGDTIQISEQALVFHASGQRSPRAWSPLGISSFRARVQEEINRSVRFRRQFTTLCMAVRTPTLLTPVVLQRIRQCLRSVDVLGLAGDGSLFVLLPESQEGAQVALAQRIQGELASLGLEASLGVAQFPADGVDPDSVLQKARAGARFGRGPQERDKVQGKLLVGGKELVVADASMTRIYELLRRLATADLPVLIGGETGTGKEMVATALHEWSRQASGPFVVLNCSAIPEQLAESELFGHERGSFSGAIATKQGLVEAANGGTLFLDEVGDMPLTCQAKLLRFLETSRFLRIGETREREAKVRVVAATNRNLEESIRSGTFRRDLFYRLNGARVWIPPLRDRRQEIPPLAQLLLSTVSATKKSLRLTPEATQFLVQQPWPGNVRELRNLMERLAASATTDEIDRATIEGIFAEGAPEPERRQPLQADGGLAPGDLPEGSRFRALQEEVEALERERISAALRAAGGNKTKAARLLQIPLRTFLSKVKRYGLAEEPAVAEEITSHSVPGERARLPGEQ